MIAGDFSEVHHRSEDEDAAVKGSFARGPVRRARPGWLGAEAPARQLLKESDESSVQSTR